MMLNLLNGPSDARFLYNFLGKITACWMDKAACSPITTSFLFQAIFILFLSDCHPHPQASHHIYSESDLLAVDSQSHSYSVSVAAPQSFIDQLAMDSQAVSKQVILPTPLPGVGPKQQVGLAGD